MRQSQSFHVRKCELRSAQVCGFRFSKESHSSGPVPECQCHLLTSAQGSAGLGISPRQAVTLYVRKKSRHLRSVNAAAAEIKCQDLFSGVYTGLLENCVEKWLFMGMIQNDLRLAFKIPRE